MPVRIQRKRTKGWKMPSNTVYVGRPTKWGNPYQLCGDGSVKSREALIYRYRGWLVNVGRIEQIGELRGKNLACFCPLDQPCHADVLLEIANV